MRNASPKKILSFMLCVIMAFSVVFMAVSGVSCATAGNRNFYVNSFSKETLAQKCDNQLAKRYEPLSKSSGLPLDVFTSVSVKFNTHESLKQAGCFVFDENDSTLKNGSRFTFFKNTINEYLNANSIKMSDEAVNQIATEAQQIYSDVVGIHSLTFLQTTVDEKRQEAVGLLSASLLFFAVAVALLRYIHGKGFMFLSYAGSGIMTGGVATIVSSLAMRFAKISTEFDVSPDVWKTVFSDMAKMILTYRTICGILILAIGVVAFVVAQSRLDREKMRKDTRYSKIFLKL